MNINIENNMQSWVWLHPFLFKRLVLSGILKKAFCDAHGTERVNITHFNGTRKNKEFRGRRRGRLSKKKGLLLLGSW